MPSRSRSLAQHVLVLALAVLAWRGRGAARGLGLFGLVGVWARSYRRYRDFGRLRTANEYEQLRSADWDAFSRHYNERVPTIEEEFDLWGDYHQHRHEMRYDLVADAVRRHLPAGRRARVLDVGCGSALVADRLRDLDVDYVGVDFGGHHIEYAGRKYAGFGPGVGGSGLRAGFAQCKAEELPFPDDSFDVVVLSEVIEHLLRPEDAVWEIARVLRPGGVQVMTTNNASELPLRSPLVNPGAWLEKGLGFHRPELISYRPWAWPEPVHASLLPADSGEVHLPHSHHIVAETARLYAAAGFDVFDVSTFEFPPAQSPLAARLEAGGPRGQVVVDAIEAVATRTPFVRRLGAHMLLLARSARPPVTPTPPPGIWPGPFSD